MNDIQNLLIFGLFARSNVFVCPQAKDSTAHCQIKIILNKYFYFMMAKELYDCNKPRTSKKDAPTSFDSQQRKNSIPEQHQSLNPAIRR